MYNQLRNSLRDVNANLWLRGDLVNPTANGHSEQIKDKLKMNAKCIFLFLLKPFLKDVCFIKVKLS